MAEGCADCLRTQLGFLAEVEYPLSTAIEAPEPVYCVDGVPVVTPHRGMVGPFVANSLIPAQTPVTTGAGALTDFTGVTMAPINWVNDSARQARLLAEVSLIATFSVGAFDPGTIRLGIQYNISSPATSILSTIDVTIAAGSGGFGFPLDLGVVDSGATVNIAPHVRYFFATAPTQEPNFYGGLVTVSLRGGLL